MKQNGFENLPIINLHYEPLFNILKIFIDVFAFIRLQLENEYGSYSTCDEKYLKELYNLARSHLGENIIIFTSDGPSNSLLKCGSSDKRYLATVNFGPSMFPIS